jgi:hypothetical protein
MLVAPNPGPCYLPGELDPQLHLPRAASELFRVQELIRCEIGVGATESVIDCSKNHSRLENARLSQGEGTVIEYVHCVYAKLNATPFG